MRLTELNLPLNFARHCISNGYVNELKVFLALRGLYERKVARRAIDYKAVSLLTGLSESTIRRNIDSFVALGWASYGKTNLYFKKFITICRANGITSGRVHRVNIKQDLPTLGELLFTLALVWLVRFRAYLRRTKSRSGNRFPEYNFLQMFKKTTLSVRYLANLLGLSPSMVHRYKHRAKALGLLTIRANHIFIEDSQEQWIAFEMPDMMKLARKRLLVRGADDIYPIVCTKSPFFS